MTKKSCNVAEISKWVMSTLASPSSSYTPPSRKLVDNHVIRAIENFYRDTQLLRRTLKIDLQCGVDDYPLEARDGYEIGEVFEVVADGRKLEPDRDFDRVDDTLFLAYEVCNDSDNGLLVDVNVIPCMDGIICELPKEVCGEFRETIISKVLSEFYAMPEMDWANGALFRLHDVAYKRSMAMVRRKRRNNKVAKVERIKPRRFL